MQWQQRHLGPRQMAHGRHLNPDAGTCRRSGAVTRSRRSSSGDWSMRRGFATACQPNLSQIFAGRQTWSSVRRRSRCSSTAVTGTAVPSTTCRRRPTPAIGQARWLGTSHVTGTPTSALRRLGGPCSASGSTSQLTAAHSRSPLRSPNSGPSGAEGAWSAKGSLCATASAFVPFSRAAMICSPTA